MEQFCTEVLVNVMEQTDWRGAEKRSGEEVGVDEEGEVVMLEMLECVKINSEWINSELKLKLELKLEREEGRDVGVIVRKELVSVILVRMV